MKPDEDGYIGPRKPYLSAAVMRGLVSIIDRTRIEDSDELLARLWIRRTVKHRERLGCKPLTAQDARCCLPSAPGPDSPSGPGEETKETTA
jgi:hypothetical protein